MYGWIYGKEVQTMPDRGKDITEAFDKAIKEVWNDEDYYDMGYNNGLKEGKNIALELMKEREPLVPELEGGGSSWWYVCGECHGAIDEHDEYCRHCGRKVKAGK
jgi:hypothetical protein